MNINKQRARVHYGARCGFSTAVFGWGVIIFLLVVGPIKNLLELWGLM